jgi:hypothetical protein
MQVCMPTAHVQTAARRPQEPLDCHLPQRDRAPAQLCDHLWMVGEVAVLQFDMLTARPVAEYDLRTCLNGAPTIAARRLQAHDPAELDRLHTKNPSASASRADGGARDRHHGVTISTSTVKRRKSAALKVGRRRSPCASIVATTLASWT